VEIRSEAQIAAEDAAADRGDDDHRLYQMTQIDVGGEMRVEHAEVSGHHRVPEKEKRFTTKGTKDARSTRRCRDRLSRLRVLREAFVSLVVSGLLRAARARGCRRGSRRGWRGSGRAWRGRGW